jgi:Ca2+-binding RTX toxin-like protein
VSMISIKPYVPAYVIAALATVAWGSDSVVESQQSITSQSSTRAPLAFSTNFTTDQTEEQEESILSGHGDLHQFSVELNDVSLRGKTLNWEVAFTGNQPASMDDLYDAHPTIGWGGKFTVPTDAKQGDYIYNSYILGPKEDNIIEPVETYEIRFRDVATGNYILDISGAPVTLKYTISDLRKSGDPIYGTPGNDNLTGTEWGENIKADYGNDTISALGGDDIIYSGGGNDVIDAGGGDDSINAQSGNDVIDGGTGFDTVYIPKISSNYTISQQSDGSYLFSDTGEFGLGNKTLSNVEVVKFSDRDIDLITNNK